MVKRILIVLLQAVFQKVCLIISSSSTVIFLRFDRLRIKYNSQILACKQKQRCGCLGPFKASQCNTPIRVLVLRNLGYASTAGCECRVFALNCQPSYNNWLILYITVLPLSSSSPNVQDTAHSKPIKSTGIGGWQTMPGKQETRQCYCIILW